MLTGVMTNVTALHVRNGLDHRKHGCELELMILAGVVAIGLATATGVWTTGLAPANAWFGPAAIALGAVSGLVIVSTRSKERVVVPTA